VRDGVPRLARAYLAALMPDFRYRQTTATLDVRGFEFRAAGRQPIDLGWRAAFPEWQPADEKGDEAQLLPPLRNGETAHLQDPKIEDRRPGHRRVTTKAPRSRRCRMPGGSLTMMCCGSA
jgi:DNA topoisomerase IA